MQTCDIILFHETSRFKGGAIADDISSGAWVDP